VTERAAMVKCSEFKERAVNIRDPKVQSVPTPAREPNNRSDLKNGDYENGRRNA